MKRSEFEQRFGELEDSFVNPLEELEHIHFRRNGKGDYRETAIDECLKEKVGFTSTCNSIWNMMDRVINVTCPCCGKKNIPHSCGGGNGTSHSYTYRCPKCKAEVVISVMNDGISVRPYVEEETINMRSK